MSRVSSIFSQLLKEIPAPLFQRVVDTHRGECHAVLSTGPGQKPA